MSETFLSKNHCLANPDEYFFSQHSLSKVQVQETQVSQEVFAQNFMNFMKRIVLYMFLSVLQVVLPHAKSCKPKTLNSYLCS